MRIIIWVIIGPSIHHAIRCDTMIVMNAPHDHYSEESEPTLYIIAESNACTHLKQRKCFSNRCHWFPEWFSWPNKAISRPSLPLCICCCSCLGTREEPKCLGAYVSDMDSATELPVWLLINSPKTRYHWRASDHFGLLCSALVHPVPGSALHKGSRGYYRHQTCPGSETRL